MSQREELRSSIDRKGRPASAAMKPNEQLPASQSFWTVVQTESQCEHSVRLLLMRASYETYLPRIKINSRIVPLFPSYLFVRLAGRQWYPVMWTPHVTRLLMAGDHPAQLPEDVVTQIRKREHNGIVKLPNVSRKLRKGQKVRIIRGSFEGHIGLFEGQSSQDRIRLLLDLLGQAVSVELPAKDIAAFESRSKLIA